MNFVVKQDDGLRRSKLSGSVLFLTFLDPRVGHTMDVLYPFISVGQFVRNRIIISLVCFGGSEQLELSL